jgi:catechol 2,3-dioxygenase-like lactoylglutathione lyase family enzyme
MLDHVGLNVRDYEASQRFYTQALAPLGREVIMEFPHVCGFGNTDKPQFWIHQRGVPSAGTHVAITSPDRATVDAFYEAGLAAGGRNNGPPGLRPMYHKHYYGAFVLDPDGNNIEAVCHQPED